MAVNTGSSNSVSAFFNNNTTPKLYITADTDSAAEFDQVTLEHWREEGFNVTFVPFGEDGVVYTDTLKSISTGLGPGENFGIIGRSVCLNGRDELN
jgi:hypothetical protein